MEKIYIVSKKVFLVSILIFFFCLPWLKAQVSYTFTNCGATGSVGPTQTQITSAYAATNLSLTVSTTATSGIQTFTFPASGPYRVEALGASGGNAIGNLINPRVGGFGVRIIGDYNFTAGDVLTIIVGQMGWLGCGCAGGGGGSFVVRNGNIIHAAGGGGGATWDYDGVNGTTLTNGTADNPAVSAGGTNGTGGLTCQLQINSGGGGGGYLGNGQNGFGSPSGFGGFAFVNGGQGAPANFNLGHPVGGFGGGGSAIHCAAGGGGGGGYSGGAGGQQHNACTPGIYRSGGGGGGSLNTGTNQVNSTATMQGHGRVVITSLCNITLASPVNPICLGNSATITTNGINNYAWSTGSTSSSVVVSPTVTTTYTLTATSPASCVATSVITISVDTTPTVTAVSSNSNICAGETIILTAGGATTYTWTGAITNGVSFAPPATSVYTVTGSNACGTASATVPVSVVPLPNVTASINNPTICAGGSVILNGGGATSYTWNAGLPNNSAFVPPATTNYTVAGASANGCTAIAVTGVTVVPTPTIIPLATPSLICAGSGATLSILAGANHTWLPAGTFTGSTASSAYVTPTVTTNYSVIATGSMGCISQTVVLVTVVPGLPSLSITTAPGNSICPGKTVTFTASGATSYTWTNGITNGQPYTPLSPTVYTVTGTNVCGSSTATTAITFNPVPNITASVNNPTVCSGGSVIFTGGGSVTNYTWSSGITNSVAYIPSFTGNYTVTGSGANTCTASAVVGVIVINTPTTTPMATPTVICAGSTVTLSATGATAYTWTPGTNLNTATVMVAPLVPTTYTLFRTNGPCPSTSTLSIAVNPLPLVNAGGTPNQICPGAGVNLVVLGAITYTWLPGGFTFANFTVYPNFSTNYTVTGSNGTCKSTVVVSITVSPTPTITILSSTNTICQGSSVTLTAGGAQSYTWQPVNTNNSIVVVSPNATTLYTLSGTNSFGCTSSQSQVVLVKPVPNMNLASSLPYICAGNTATLSITSPAPNVLYNWSNGPTGPSILVSPTITTNYFVTGINTITGCQSTNTIALTVYISTFSVINPTAICNGETATLTAVGSATSYSWTANLTPIGTGAPSVTVAPVVNTVYYVTGTNGSCQNTESVSIVVNALPNVSAVTIKKTICRFEVSTMMGNGASSYSWSTGASTPTISFTLSLTTTYTVTGIDINGCSKSVTVTQFVATCAGTDDIENNNDTGINVYPNPNNGTFLVKSGVNVTLKVVNTIGQVVGTLNLSEGNLNEVTVSGLPGGIYFITGEYNHIKVNKRVIIER